MHDKIFINKLNKRNRKPKILSKFSRLTEKRSNFETTTLIKEN